MIKSYEILSQTEIASLHNVFLSDHEDPAVTFPVLRHLKVMLDDLRHHIPPIHPTGLLEKVYEHFAGSPLCLGSGNIERRMPLEKAEHRMRMHLIGQPMRFDLKVLLL